MEEIIEFLDARDQFVGLGNYNGNYNSCLSIIPSIEGLRRLRKCNFKEAKFVSSLFPKYTYIFGIDARNAFLSNAVGDNMAVSLCYAALFHDEGHHFDKERLLIAANLGNSYAQGIMSKISTSVSDEFEWAQLAAVNGDRGGLEKLGWCYERGEDCEKNMQKAIKAYKEAAELGDARACISFGSLSFDKDDPQRYYWRGKAARYILCYAECFLDDVEVSLKAYENGQRRASVILMLGRMLKGHVSNTSPPTVFGRITSKTRMDDVHKVMQLYESCCWRARDSTLCWMACAKRFSLYKDVARIIGNLVWEQRDAFMS